MSNEANEKAQFLMAAANILKWKDWRAEWSSDVMRFVFPGPFTLPVDHNDALQGWGDLSHTEKLGAAQSALQAVAAENPAFDPTRPGWVEFTATPA